MKLRKEHYMEGMKLRKERVGKAVNIWHLAMTWIRGAVDDMSAGLDRKMLTGKERG